MSGLGVNHITIRVQEPPLKLYDNLLLGSSLKEISWGFQSGKGSVSHAEITIHFQTVSFIFSGIAQMSLLKTVSNCETNIKSETRTKH